MLCGGCTQKALRKLWSDPADTAELLYLINNSKIYHGYYNYQIA